MLELKVTVQDRYWDTVPIEYVEADYTAALEAGEVQKFCDQFAISPDDLEPFHHRLLGAIHRLNTTDIGQNLVKVDQMGFVYNIPNGNVKLEIIDEDGKLLWEVQASSYKKPI